MRLTEQQALVMFDITKSAMNQKGGFAGYSNNDLMQLLNEIISQQDNKETIELVEIETKEKPKKVAKKTNKKKEKEIVDITEQPTSEEIKNGDVKVNVEVIKTTEDIIEVKKEAKEVEEKIVESTKVEEVEDEDFW